jgi:hypothetical protein
MFKFIYIMCISTMLSHLIHILTPILLQVSKIMSLWKKKIKRAGLGWGAINKPSVADLDFVYSSASQDYWRLKYCMQNSSTHTFPGGKIAVLSPVMKKQLKYL